MKHKIKLGLVDDHQLFLKSLGLMIESFQNFSVTVEALNGSDLQLKMKGVTTDQPDIMLIDINMPKMNGFATAAWLHENYPEIKLVALSMNADDHSIISMFKAGVCSYLLKDTHPAELEKALNEIFNKGYYNADAANVNYRRLLIAGQETDQLQLTEKEKLFLQLACSDRTYKLIAHEMGITERNVDFMREVLFGKFKVQSRVGLCLEAIRKKIVNL